MLNSVGIAFALSGSVLFLLVWRTNPGFSRSCLGNGLIYLLPSFVWAAALLTLAASSFFLARTSISRNRRISTVVVFLALGFLVIPFTVILFQPPPTTSSHSSLVEPSGTMIISTGSGTGTFTLSVCNTANNLVASVSLQINSSDQGLTLGYPGSFYSAGGQPLPVFNGNLQMGSATPTFKTGVYGATAGHTYAFTIIVEFPGNESETQALNVTAGT